MMGYLFGGVFEPAFCPVSACVVLAGSHLSDSSTNDGE